MKNLKDIIEGQNFLVNKKLQNRQQKYEYRPRNSRELEDIIVTLLRKKITDLNCIDVSQITDMQWLFFRVEERLGNSKANKIHEIDISEWDVSNVTVMSYMFWQCKYFNADLSKWNVSNVTKTPQMFGYCENFCCDLSSWNITNITDMDFMFFECNSLEKNNLVPKWYKGTI